MWLKQSAHGPAAGEHYGGLGTIVVLDDCGGFCLALVEQCVAELRGRAWPAMERGFVRSCTMSKRGTMGEHGARSRSESRRWTERQGRQVVAEWRKIGLSASEFARRHGMNSQRLSWWSKRLGELSTRKEADGRRTSLISLVPAEVRMRAPVSAALSLAVMRLPCGISIEFADAGAMSAGWVASLVSALSRES